jgi:hypothetical protein
MPTLAPIQSLSKRLDPIRAEFAMRIYKASLAILESQIRNEASLFWRSPSRLVQNLKKVLGANSEDRVRFFLICHGYRYRSFSGPLNIPVPNAEEQHAILKMCMHPSRSDVAQWQLLPLETPKPRIDQRKLNAAIQKHLGNSYQETRDPNSPTERWFSTRVGAWQFVWLIDKPRHAQLSIELDVRIGMGPLSLARQISLTGFYGVAGHIWNLTSPGDEEHLADYVKNIPTS